jgi:hypothetical protein
MTVIDAVGRDARSILPGLQGGSPASGGQVASQPFSRTELTPGHLVRHHGAWAVITGIRHDGPHGITTAGLIDARNTLHQITLYGPQTAEARTDTEIDADTLYKLIRYLVRKLCDDCYEAVTGLFAECQDYCSLPLDHAGTCDPRRETDEPCDRCGRTGSRLTEHEPQDDDEAAACQPVIATGPASAASPAGLAEAAPGGRVYFLNPATMAAALGELARRVPGAGDAEAAVMLLGLLSRARAHCSCCTGNQCECGGTALAGGA